MKVGVLALQGGFAPHVARLREIGLTPLEVRDALGLRDAEGIVLPGGESTAQYKLIAAQPGLLDALRIKVRTGTPVLATCAGLILAARLRWLDVEVERNGWGRQVCSAEAEADDGTPLVLIRAPRIRRVGEGVSVERTYRDEPVLVRSGRVWGATYHPELVGAALHEQVFGGGRSARLGEAREGNAPDLAVRRRVRR